MGRSIMVLFLLIAMISCKLSLLSVSKSENKTNIPADSTLDSSQYLEKLKERWISKSILSDRIDWCESIPNRKTDPFFKLFPKSLNLNDTPSSESSILKSLQSELGSLQQTSEDVKTYPFHNFLSTNIWSDAAFNMFDLGLFSKSPQKEKTTWMAPTDYVGFLRKLKEKGLELAFYDSIVSVFNVGFFKKVIEDLAYVRKISGLSIEQILSRYEEISKFTYSGEIPKLDANEFLKMIEKPVVWRENYQDASFKDVPWEKLKTKEISIKNLRELLKNSIIIANGAKIDGFPIPHGRFSHRLQNYFQLRYRDACNYSRQSNESFGDLRAIIGDKSGFQIFWRSVFDEVGQAVSLGNPHLFAFLTGIVDQDVGCFLIDGTC
jgi:hypothetical protein